MTSDRSMSDPNDPLILAAEQWRREPHLFSCFALWEKHRGQIRTFLVKIESVRPLRVSDGEMSVSARFNLCRVPATKRSLVAEGRTFQIVARLNQNILSIYDIALMRDASQASLTLRRRVAHVLDHVSLECHRRLFVNIFLWRNFTLYMSPLVPAPRCA